jgi:hypothetical protein
VEVHLLEVEEMLEQEIHHQQVHHRVITVERVQEINLLSLTWVLKAVVVKALLEVMQ